VGDGLAQQYWLFFIDARGDVVRRESVRAQTDEEAIRIANELRQGERASLWYSMRNVKSFPGS
jgi:hypothetical protein